MTLSWPQKTTAEILDYTLNWAAALGSDTIASSAWAISPAGLVLDHGQVTGKLAIAWLKSGADNTLYTIVNTLVTVGGRTFQQTVTLRVGPQT